MQYISGYYRQQNGGSSSALVLQQAVYKKNNMPVLLACICTPKTAKSRKTAKKHLPEEREERENAGREARLLADWFYDRGLAHGKKGGERAWTAMAGSFTRVLRQTDRTANIETAGILCAGEHILLFGNGAPVISLLNTRNARANCRKLLGDDSTCPQYSPGEFHCREGILQRGIGILVATETFYGQTRLLLAECLRAEKMKTQEHLDKRLKELGSFGEERGGTDMGAILLCTV